MINAIFYFCRHCTCQQKEILRHVVRQDIGAAASHPAEALLGDSCAVTYKKISCLKSIGGLSPSGIQNKLVVGKRQEVKSLLFAHYERPKGKEDQYKWRIGVKRRIYELFLRFFFSVRREKKQVSNFPVSRLFFLFFSSGKYQTCRQAF